MTASDDKFLITLPRATSEGEVAALRNSLDELDGIKGTQPLVMRGVDPGSIMIAVQVAGGILNAAKTAAPIIGQIASKIRGQGISGATIELRGVGKISVEHASAADIERLLQVMEKK